MAPLPDMSPRAGRKGSMMKRHNKRTGSVSFHSSLNESGEDDEENNMREGVSEMADGETRKQAAESIGENNYIATAGGRSRAASLLRPSVGGGGALSSLMDAASDDMILEQMYVYLLPCYVQLVYFKFFFFKLSFQLILLSYINHLFFYHTIGA